MTFDQSEYDIRCEWGERGLSILAPSADAVVIVDVLSFSTCVEIGTTRGAKLFPYRWKDDSAREFSLRVGAELARPRGMGGFSLAPASFLEVPSGARVVLPSPNGAMLSMVTGGTPTLAGCFRNAGAVARAATRYGSRIAVVAAGEKWPDGTLRPGLEDWLGAGAIIANLPGRLSPEARAARDAFQSSAPDLLPLLRACGSGKELIERGFEQDVLLAGQLNVSDGVPVLEGEAYVSLDVTRSESAE